MSDPKISTATEKGERLLSISLPILQGLLASGHYTQPETDEDVPRVITIDNGDGWKSAEGVFARRHSSMAIEDAIKLAGELADQVKMDEASS